MAKDIKTRESRLGIKTKESLISASERARDAAIRTRDSASDRTENGQDSPTDYAENSVRNGAEETLHGAGRGVKNGAKKGRDFARKRYENRSENATKKASEEAKKAAENAARKAAKTAEKASKETAKNAEKTAKNAEKAAEKAAQAAKKAAETAAKAAKKAGEATVRIARAIYAGIVKLAAAIAAGGWVAVAIILAVILVVGAVVSVFCFWVPRDSSAPMYSVREALQSLQQETDAEIGKIQADTPHDMLEMHGEKVSPKTVLAAFAVRAGIDLNAGEFVPMTEENRWLFSDTYSQLTEVLWKTEKRRVPEQVETVGSGGIVTYTTVYVEKTVLTVEIVSLDAGEAAARFGFDNVQLDLMMEYIVTFGEVWEEVMG